MRDIFTNAKLENNIFSTYHKSMEGKVLASLFLQPSTRTQLSFQSAFVKLGGSYIGFSDINESRSGPPYYEPLDDMGKIVSNYCDIIVMRTINANYTNELINGSNVPIISGGSGNTEHPTQALTDLYTLTKIVGDDISNLNILIIGTPRQRTINSFLLGLTYWDNIHIHILCQEGIYISPQVLQKLDKLKINYYSSCTEFLESNKSHNIDVMYIDKIFNETNSYDEFVFTEHQLYHDFRKELIILHPLPRTKELPRIFDLHPGALYFLQAQNGLYVRASLFLYYLLK